MEANFTQKNKESSLKSNEKTIVDNENKNKYKITEILLEEYELKNLNPSKLSKELYSYFENDSNVLTQ